jgi:hypothetical protein
MSVLPPDLSRLGDELQDATDRALRRRRRRLERAGRLGLCGLAGVIVLAAAAPGPLAPGERFAAPPRTLPPVTNLDLASSPACDQPRGASFRSACLDHDDETRLLPRRPTVALGARS